jgi:hypothetical protein
MAPGEEGQIKEDSQVLAPPARALVIIAGDPLQDFDEDPYYTEYQSRCNY